MKILFGNFIKKLNSLLLIKSVIKLTMNSAHSLESNCVSLPIDAVLKTLPQVSLICDDFPICIRTLTGKETYMNVHHKMIVSELKDMIEKIEQTPFDQQRLVYNGKQLEDDRTLDYYNIQKNTVVHIILRIRGGMFHETSARKDFELVQFATEVKNDMCPAWCIQIKELEEKIRLLKQ